MFYSLHVLVENVYTITVNTFMKQTSASHVERGKLNETVLLHHITQTSVDSKKGFYMCKVLFYAAHI